jgi:hypothetical protein
MSSTVSQPNRLEPQRHDRTSPPQAAVDQPPRVRRITVAVAALLAAVSATGLVWGSGLYGSSAPSTLAGALVAIGLAAYAGLIGNALPELGEATTDVAFRSQWAVDMALGTPVLIVGGVLLWRRAPWGYATAAALLLVSTLGGAAFAAAAVFEQLLGDQPLDTAVVAVHSTISAIALLLLVVLLRGADRANSSAAGGDG